MKVFVKSHKRAFFCLLLHTLLLVVMSCKGDGDQGPSIEEARKIQVAAVFDYEILPLHQQHIEALEKLKEATIAFRENTILETLGAVKEKWKEAFLLWKQCELFNIGVIQESFVHSSIHSWPCNVSFIEKNIGGTKDLTTDFINSQGSTSKGYSAIEYLLFDKGSSEIVQQFTTAKNAVRRLDYLKALVENLIEKSGQVLQSWKDYGTTFKTNVSSGIEGGQNQLANAFIALIENIKNKKIGAAVKFGLPDPEKLEAFRSLNSLEAIQANLKTIHAVYLGDYGGKNYKGFYEYLKDIGREALAESIKTKIEQLFDKFEAINAPLETTIKDAGLIEELNNSLKELIARVKTDMTSAIGIVVTFNDNDGD